MLSDQELLDIREKLVARANFSFMAGLAFVALAALLATAIITGFGVIGSSLLDELMTTATAGTSSSGEAAVSFGSSSLFTLLVPQSILKLGAVVLAIYLIQLVISFARYYFRLADHLQACGVAVMIARNDFKQFVDIVATIAPASINFGKLPEPLSHKMIAALTEFAKTVRGG